MNTWKPTTPAELKAIAEAAAQVEAKGFTFAPDSAYIADIGGFGEHTAFAFSRETQWAYNYPRAEGAVSFTKESGKSDGTAPCDKCGVAVRERDFCGDEGEFLCPDCYDTDDYDTD